MTKADVQKSVIAIVAKVLDKDQGAFGVDFDLSKDLWADSLDLVQIVLGLEEEFPVTLHDLDWSSTGQVTPEGITEDIWKLLGEPEVLAWNEALKSLKVAG